MRIVSQRGSGGESEGVMRRSERERVRREEGVEICERGGEIKTRKIGLV